MKITRIGRLEVTLLAVGVVPLAVLVVLLCSGDSAATSIEAYAATVAGFGTAASAFFAATAAESSSDTARRADEALARALGPTLLIEVLDHPQAEPDAKVVPQVVRVWNDGDTIALDVEVEWVGADGSMHGPKKVGRLEPKQANTFPANLDAPRRQGWSVIEHVVYRFTDEQRLRKYQRRRRATSEGLYPPSRIAFTPTLDEPYEP